jgi:hypothetical protein
MQTIPIYKNQNNWNNAIHSHLKNIPMRSLITHISFAGILLFWALSSALPL